MFSQSVSIFPTGCSFCSLGWLVSVVLLSKWIVEGGRIPVSIAFCRAGCIPMESLRRFLISSLFGCCSSGCCFVVFGCWSSCCSALRSRNSMGPIAS